MQLRRLSRCHRGESQAECGASSTSPIGVEPTLGRRSPWNGADGFGEVRPSRIFNGGDPTGLFEDVTWKSWGSPDAIGSGTGWWVGDAESVAAGEYAPIGLVAYDLTECDGELVYRRLTVYFPTKGESFDPATNGEAQYDLCTYE